MKLSKTIPKTILVFFLLFSSIKSHAMEHRRSLSDSGDGSTTPAIREAHDAAVPAHNLRDSYIEPRWFFDPTIPTNQYRKKVDKFTGTAPQLAEPFAHIRNNPGMSDIAQKTKDRLLQREKFHSRKAQALSLTGVLVSHYALISMQPIDPTQEKLFAKSTAALILACFIWEARDAYQRAAATEDLREVYSENIVSKLTRERTNETY